MHYEVEPCIIIYLFFFFPQDLYFKKRPYNTLPHVKLKDVDRLTKDVYEEDMNRLISQASVLDHTLPPCEDSFVPDTTGKSYVMYIQMYNEQDYETWSVLAKVSF